MSSAGRFGTSSGNRDELLSIQHVRHWRACYVAWQRYFANQLSRGLVVGAEAWIG